MSAERCLPISFVDQLVQRILDGSKTQTRRLMDLASLRVRLLKRVESEPILMLVGAGRSADPGVYHAKLNPQGAVSLVEQDLGLRPGEFDFVTPWGTGTTKLVKEQPSGRSHWSIAPAEGLRLWVRESYQFLPRTARQWAERPRRYRIRYRADGAEQDVILAPAELAKLEARKSGTTKPQPGRFLYRSCARIFLRVTSLRAERLQDITEEDARAEGMDPGCTHGPMANPCPTSYRLAFRRTWDELNGQREGASWAANPWVWVPGFSVDQVLVRGEGRAA
jgi:hypothetical protein